MWLLYVSAAKRIHAFVFIQIFPITFPQVIKFLIGPEKVPKMAGY